MTGALNVARHVLHAKACVTNSMIPICRAACPAPDEAGLCVCYQLRPWSPLVPTMVDPACLDCANTRSRMTDGQQDAGHKIEKI